MVGVAPLCQHISTHLYIYIYNIYTYIETYVYIYIYMYICVFTRFVCGGLFGLVLFV